MILGLYGEILKTMLNTEKQKIEFQIELKKKKIEQELEKEINKEIKKIK